MVENKDEWDVVYDETLVFSFL